MAYIYATLFTFCTFVFGISLSDQYVFLTIPLSLFGFALCRLVLLTKTDEGFWKERIRSSGQVSLLATALTAIFVILANSPTLQTVGYEPKTLLFYLAFGGTLLSSLVSEAFNLKTHWRTLLTGSAVLLNISWISTLFFPFSQ